MWTAGGGADNKRSLGDKRRHLTGGQIDEIVRLYGCFRNDDRSKRFTNTDFGYTRVTVERPLRLRYQMTLDDKARFLDACPHLLDDVQAIDKALGREPHRDWNAVWSDIEDVLHARKSRWKATEQKLFRSVFAQKDSEAEPVAAGGSDGECEPDADLRHFENVPLTDDIDTYFERDVRPPRARRLDGPREGQGRLRDQLQPPFSQVHAAAPAGGDRCGAEASGGRDHAPVAGGDDVTALSRDNCPPRWSNPPVYARYSVQLGKMLDQRRITGTHLAPYLRNVDVQWECIHIDNLPLMDFSDEDRRRYALEKGDLLVCEGGRGRANRNLEWKD